jgi:hypothetical protein
MEQRGLEGAGFSTKGLRRQSSESWIARHGQDHGVSNQIARSGSRPTPLSNRKVLYQFLDLGRWQNALGDRKALAVRPHRSPSG